MTDRAQQIRELEKKVEAFIRTDVIPFEKDPRNAGHGPASDLIRELKDKAVRAGLNAPQLPKSWGGLDLTHRETAVIFKAAGYSMLGPPAMNIMAPDEGNMHLIAKIATPAQAERFLKPLAAGKIRSAFLMTEPDDGAGSDPSMLKTVAKRENGAWVVNGRKWLITGAPGAGCGILMAKTDGGATLFLIDMKTPGLHIERILDTIDNSMEGGHAVMRLENMRIPDDQVLGEVDQGFKYAQIRLAPARLTHCMRWWGSAKRAHDIAIDYACRREAFGKLLVDHEGVGFMLADNEIDLQQASLMIDWCADVLDRGEPGTAESSMAKVAVSEALFRVADRCVQVLGGMGITRDTVVEQVFREIRAFRIYDGPSEVHRWAMAKRIKRQHLGKNA